MFPTKNVTAFPPKVTGKGTELPLVNLKGKPYLQVAHRLVWFEEENPQYHISTDFLVINENETIVKATIFILDVKGQAIRKVSATKRETKEGFADHTEKAETGAIGRALAMLGYGTQFAPELDEGNRLADSPIDIARKLAAPVVEASAVAAITPPPEVPVEVSPVMDDSKVARPSFRKKKLDEPKGDLW